MRVRILGSGDAFGSGGRFNTCFHVEAGDRRLLVDCGASSLVAMRRFGVDPGAVDAVILSHMHGDHFGGLPFLLLYDQHVARREAPLAIAGPPGVEARLQASMEALFPGAAVERTRFPLAFIELAAGREAEVCGARVTPVEVEHPSGAPSYALRLVHGGRTFAYSGDTRWTESLLEAARGADLFLIECYAFDAELPYHMSYATLRQHLPRLEARRVLLTHMSEAMLARLGEVDCEAAHDGMEIDL